MKKLSIAVTLFLASCSTANKLTPGYYTVKEITGQTVTLNEKKGIFFLPGDTLKAKDKIVIGSIKRF